MSEFTNYVLEIIKIVKTSKFIAKVGYLGASTFFSQLLTLVNLAIIARLFSQTDIGIYSVFVSYYTIISSFVLLSYQYSLPNLDDTKCRILTYGIILVLTLISIIVGSIAALVEYHFAFELFLLAFSGGFSILMDMLNIRDQKIILLSIKRILTSALSMLFLGVVWSYELENNSEILIWSIVVTNIVIATLYSVTSLRRHLFPVPSFKEIISVLIAKKRDPLFLAPSNLITAVSKNLPVILIQSFFGSIMAAQYSMVLRFCVAPISLFGNTIANIYHSKVSESVRSKNDRAYGEYIKLKKYVGILALIVMLGTVLLMPIIIRTALGPGWEDAARFAQILAPMYAIMLYVEPRSMLFFVFNEQRFLLLAESLYMCIALISFGIASYMLNIWVGIVLFSVLSVLRSLYISSKIDLISSRLVVSNTPAAL